MTSTADSASPAAPTRSAYPLASLLTLFDANSRTSRREWISTVCIWAFWTVLALILMLNHEPWRDELQAWAIARASDTPIDILSNIRHEGHPPLWFLLLWPFAKLIGDTLMLQVITFVLGSTATWLTLRHMPVRLWLRVALVFGYFPLYELGVMSRNYSLAYALVIIFLWLSHRPGTPPWLPPLVALAIAGTAINSLPLAIGLTLAVWGGPFFASKRRGPVNWKVIAPAAAIVSLIALIAVPAAGGGRKIYLTSITPSYLWETFAAPLRAIVPVSENVRNFWGHPYVAQWTTWGPILGFVLVVCVAVAVRRSRSALTIWIAVAATMPFLILATRMPIGPRYISPYFSALVAAVWFAAADRSKRPAAERRPVSPLIAVAATILLGLSMWASYWAASMELKHPFSGGAAAADWIKDNTDGDRPVVILCATTSPICSTVFIRLDVPAYMTADAQPIEFVDWTRGWSVTMSKNMIGPQARELEEVTGAQVFVVTLMTNVPAGCGAGLSTTADTTTEYITVCRADQIVPM